MSFCDDEICTIVAIFAWVSKMVRGGAPHEHPNAEKSKSLAAATTVLALACMYFRSFSGGDGFPRRPA